MNDIVADFSYFSSLTMAALLWRLAELGLFSRLPWFGIWLTIRLVQTPVLQLLRNFPDVQTQVWILSDALLLGSMVLTAVEIYFELTRVVFELGRAGPAVALFALILGTAVALTSTGGLADAASIQQGVFCVRRWRTRRGALVLWPFSTAGCEPCLASRPSFPDLCGQSCAGLLGASCVWPRDDERVGPISDARMVHMPGGLAMAVFEAAILSLASQPIRTRNRQPPRAAT
jgi:hypothetical protein